MRGRGEGAEGRVRVWCSDCLRQGLVVRGSSTGEPRRPVGGVTPPDGWLVLP
jgi:hypothetical protein